jgi:hypothetical protein
MLGRLPIAVQRLHANRRVQRPRLPGQNAGQEMTASLRGKRAGTAQKLNYGHDWPNKFIADYGDHM